METSVIDLLVPTDIQVDDIDNNTSKITLRAIRKRLWPYARQCTKKNSFSSMPGAAITDVTIEVFLMSIQLLKALEKMLLIYFKP